MVSFPQSEIIVIKTTKNIEKTKGKIIANITSAASTLVFNQVNGCLSYFRELTVSLTEGTAITYHRCYVPPVMLVRHKC